MRNTFKVQLLKRMDDITAYYKEQLGVKAIVAFGSLADLTRFDDWSDLDFLVICNPSEKKSLLENLVQLDKIYPVAYRQIEYEDAVKLLFEDGILCDFGIVTQEQVLNFPHGQGRILWSDESFLTDCIQFNIRDSSISESDNWIGDILLHIYVGLLRQHRGELAAAFEEIQVLAVRKLIAGIWKDNNDFPYKDHFSPLRRLEKVVFPMDKYISDLMPGYLHNLEAARKIISWIKEIDYPEKLMKQVEQLLVE